ncbi:MAG: hypothetical protein WKF84_21625 [Pyrinomonadaceae bacterium]
MISRISRAALALALICHLGAGVGFTALAAQQQQQPQIKIETAEPPPPPPQQTAKTTDVAAAPTTGSAVKRPLSVNEDPALIGKRNINKGIIAKVSGSPEKDVNMGRQLAAEVDRQAKFIEDPLITEYVNRVGQNVVLHSDAKVPFTIKVVDSDEVNALCSSWRLLLRE